MSNREIDIRTDEGFDALIGLFALDCRRKVATVLLRGNDTQCFTTRQYLDAYIRIIERATPSIMSTPASKPRRG